MMVSSRHLRCTPWVCELTRAHRWIPPKDTTPQLQTVELASDLVTLDLAEEAPVAGLPVLTVERTIADLVEIGPDTSLVADALRDAIRGP